MKMRIKKYILILFLSIEIIIVFCAFICGKHGLFALHALQKKIVHHQEKMNTIKNDINVLKETIQNIELHPFYKEKIAREDLQFFKSGEHVYIID